MEFEFKENYRNITDSEFIEDIQRVAGILKSTTLTRTQYDKYGKYHSSTIYRRFNGWTNALKKAKLEIKKNQINNISKEELIDDIKSVANKLSLNTITSSQYKKYGKYDIKPIFRVFNSWSNALIESGLDKTGYNHNITDLELFKDIENMWVRKGCQPTTSDIRKGLSSYGLNTFCRRFGGWNNALKAFINYINEDVNKEKNEEELLKVDGLKIEKYEKRKTNREINLRLRFKILKRDNFRCCKCGMSPAKDPSVELHVDHIIPWAKGGETIEENLQTLCSKCNIGKSDVL